MHPKTFNVRLTRPFSKGDGTSISLHLHVESAQDALAWTTRVFEGVNIAPTLQRWQLPRSEKPRVGNSDPVVIVDCDAFQTSQRAAGLQAAPTPPGASRRSVQEVQDDLFQAFERVANAHRRYAQTFQQLKASYEKGREPAWMYERLKEYKQICELTLKWQDNLWSEYKGTLAHRGLEMPALSQTRHELGA